MSILGGNIRRLRKRHLLTQQDLGELLGMTNLTSAKVTISRIELTGKCSVERLLGLCEVFGVTPNELLGFQR
jgi:transcriptional regulator with XRE-family HTH domain